MNMLNHELRKIIAIPAIWGFIGCALVMNFVIAFMSLDPYANYIAEVSRTTGFVLGEDFNQRAQTLLRIERERFAQVPHYDLASRQFYATRIYHAERLMNVTRETKNPLYGFNAIGIADAYIRELGLIGRTSDLMRRKYNRLQDVVDGRMETGEAMTLYFADITRLRHRAFFDNAMRVLLIQGILLGALTMLISLGYEYNSGTEGVVYSSKTGRRVTHAKLIAAIIAGIAGYVIIAGISIPLYLAVNPFGGTWGSSVSGGFNMMPSHPIFITWHNLTIGGYLLVSALMSVGLVLCFALMAYIIGLWNQNSFVAFLALFLVNSALFFLPDLVGMNMAAYIAALSPPWLLRQQAWWFTSGGSYALWPHFETIGVLGALVVFVMPGILSWKKFKWRNML